MHLSGALRSALGSTLHYINSKLSSIKDYLNRSVSNVESGLSQLTNNSSKVIELKIEVYRFKEYGKGLIENIYRYVDHKKRDILNYIETIERIEDSIKSKERDLQYMQNESINIYGEENLILSLKNSIEMQYTYAKGKIMDLSTLSVQNYETLINHEKNKIDDEISRELANISIERHDNQCSFHR